MALISEANPANATLPGLDHLRGNVHNWGTAVRTLSLTAAAIAESVGAGKPIEAAASCSCQSDDTFPFGAPTTSEPAHPSQWLGPNLPTHIVPGGRLKPGRVFVVANLQGAYYTLLEFLSRQKFDFRCDNLLHLGNLVAAPAAVPPVKPVAMAPVKPVAMAPPSRRVRNSTSVLKLLRRHGGVGPMGAHECLALLAAAHANRICAQQQVAEEQRLAALLASKQQEAASSMAIMGSMKPGASNGRYGALSLQMAAVVAVPVPASPVPARCVGTAKPANWLASESDSSDDGDDMEVEIVAAPMTPHRDEYALPVAPSAPTLAAGSGLSLDNTDLAQMLSMPACVVLESYGVRLQHAGPTSAADTTAVAASGIRYHTLFSHRWAGGGGGGGCNVAATIPAAGSNAHCTGLATSRNVVRFAVLPPLRTLQRLSPGFAVKTAAAAAPSREDLMLEVLEEPLSELDA